MLMMDIRYHIATLIAVFLALGIGILIGSTMVGSDVLSDQQKKIIDQLEEQFELLRQKEEGLASRVEFMNGLLKHYEDFTEALVPSLVANRLEGMKMGLVVTGGSDVPSGVLSSLSLAGAKVVSTTVVLPGMGLSSEPLRSRLASAYGMEEESSPEALRAKVSESVADIILNKDMPEMKRMLEQNDLVKFNGDYSVPLDAVIILGGANGLDYYFPETVDVPLMSRLSAAGVRVVGAEVMDVKYSYMEVYQAQKITTVDDIDIIPGQVSLILAVGGESGNYGVKPTAKKFMPSLLPVYAGGPQ